MKVLNCKVCDNPTECSEEAVAVTCYKCVVNGLMKHCVEINSFALSNMTNLEENA
jgi:hypothetical protein